jgi:hypothetical protein
MRFYKGSEHGIVENALPSPPIRLFFAESVCFSLMLSLYCPFHLNAVKRLCLLHSSMTSFGE